MSVDLRSSRCFGQGWSHLSVLLGEGTDRGQASGGTVLEGEVKGKRRKTGERSKMGPVSRHVAQPHGHPLERKPIPPFGHHPHRLPLPRGRPRAAASFVEVGVQP